MLSLAILPSASEGVEIHRCPERLPVRRSERDHLAGGRGGFSCVGAAADHREGATRWTTPRETRFPAAVANRKLTPETRAFERDRRGRIRRSRPSPSRRGSGSSSTPVAGVSSSPRGGLLSSPSRRTPSAPAGSAIRAEPRSAFAGIGKRLVLLHRESGSHAVRPTAPSDTCGVVKGDALSARELQRAMEAMEAHLARVEADLLGGGAQRGD